MVIENVYVKMTEENLLHKAIGKKLFKISSEDSSNFSTDFMWTIYFDFEDLYFKIERADIVAKLFNEDEDGGIPIAEKVPHDSSYEKFTKNINRIVKDVLIVIDTFEFSNYKITYPKAIIFQFDDCNLVIEKLWLFSLAGFLVFLDSPDAENYGLTDEMQFWYDPAEDDEKPLASQKIKSLKQGGFID